jgi:hypothetical protein
MSVWVAMSEKNSGFMFQFSEQDFLSLKVSSVKNSLCSLGENLCSLGASLRLSFPDYSFTFLSSCVSFQASWMSLNAYYIQVYGAHTTQSLYRTASGSLYTLPGINCTCRWPISEPRTLFQRYGLHFSYDVISIWLQTQSSSFLSYHVYLSSYVV